jgi:hypothetical protein
MEIGDMKDKGGKLGEEEKNERLKSILINTNGIK